MPKTVVLGDEYDDQLKERLIDELKSMGAIPLSSDWSLGGSQELATYSVRIGDDVLDIKSETYVGLSLRGADALVDRISARLKK